MHVRKLGLDWSHGRHYVDFLSIVKLREGRIDSKRSEQGQEG